MQKDNYLRIEIDLTRLTSCRRLLRRSSLCRDTTFEGLSLPSRLRMQSTFAQWYVPLVDRDSDNSRVSVAAINRALVLPLFNSWFRAIAGVPPLSPFRFGELFAGVARRFGRRTF
jgi:hypothetical protein